jgi:hypothetical protein
MATKIIKITEFDNDRQILDTKITDAREVLRILSTAIAGFIVELHDCNPGREEDIKQAVLDTVSKMVDAGLRAKPIREVN